jgi:hypothetical protein
MEIVLIGCEVIRVVDLKPIMPGSIRPEEQHFGAYEVYLNGNGKFYRIRAYDDLVIDVLEPDEIEKLHLS